MVGEHQLAAGLLKSEHSKFSPKEYEAATQVLMDRVHIDIPRMSDILTVTMIWDSPEMAAVMLQRYLEKLDRYLRNQTIERAESNAEYLEKVASPLKDKEMIERLNSLIMTQYEQIAYARASGNYFFEVLEPPHPSYYPVGPGRANYVAGAVLLSLLLAVFLILLPFSRLNPRQVTSN
jgi:hypothetical protein